MDPLGVPNTCPGWLCAAASDQVRSRRSFSLLVNHSRYWLLAPCLRELPLRFQGRAQRAAPSVRECARGHGGKLALAAKGGREAPVGTCRIPRRPLALVQKPTAAARQDADPGSPPHRLGAATHRTAPGAVTREEDLDRDLPSVRLGARRKDGPRVQKSPTWAAHWPRWRTKTRCQLSHRRTVNSSYCQRAVACRRLVRPACDVRTWALWVYRWSCRYLSPIRRICVNWWKLHPQWPDHPKPPLRRRDGRAGVAASFARHIPVLSYVDNKSYRKGKEYVCIDQRHAPQRLHAKRSGAHYQRNRAATEE
jgi:hypothetical protein